MAFVSHLHPPFASFTLDHRLSRLPRISRLAFCHARYSISHFTFTHVVCVPVEALYCCHS